MDLDQLMDVGVAVVRGRMPYSSNGTFLVELGPADDPPDEDGPFRIADAVERLAIYKPVSMEKPLWDFPGGLHRRERAAYVLARALGWDLVPRTVIRHDLPAGVGSLQRFVDADFEQHYFTLYEADGAPHHDQLRRMCAFDIVANNTDRKSGHCLLAHDGRIQGIDNGLSFHAEWKLRTVIWEFAGEPIPEGDLADLARLADDGLPDELTELLDPFERDATRTRLRALVEAAAFPLDDTGGHRYPWPLV